MQFAIDSFYITLRDRLAALNPQRTVLIDGIARPAVVVTANESVTPATPLADCFYVECGGAREVEALAQAPRPLLTMDCTITYMTRGKAVGGGDRGRLLGELDAELLQICAPPVTEKCDYTQSPAQPLGSRVSWERPKFEDAKQEGDGLRRTARLTIFTFAEVMA